jgi:hypothetical protein
MTLEESRRRHRLFMYLMGMIDKREELDPDAETEAVTTIVWEVVDILCNGEGTWQVTQNTTTMRAIRLA